MTTASEHFAAINIVICFVVGFVLFVIVGSFIVSSRRKKQQRNSAQKSLPQLEALPAPQAKPTLGVLEPIPRDYAWKDQKQAPSSVNAENSDRRFPNYKLRAGRERAGNRCEHTDTRTGERCKNPWKEGDHFYEYARGGATSETNLVGACRWHNDPKNPTFKQKDYKRERMLIEGRRQGYFPRGADVTVGEWRPTGLRLTFTVKNRVHRVQSADLDELIAEVKDVLHLYAAPNARTEKLDAIEEFEELFAYLWSYRGGDSRLFIDNLEGVDPLTGQWISLRKPSDWAIENPNGNA